MGTKLEDELKDCFEDKLDGDVSELISTITDVEKLLTINEDGVTSRAGIFACELDPPELFIDLLANVVHIDDPKLKRSVLRQKCFKLVGLGIQPVADQDMLDTWIDAMLRLNGIDKPTPLTRAVMIAIAGVSGDVDVWCGWLQGTQPTQKELDEVLATLPESLFGDGLRRFADQQKKVQEAMLKLKEESDG